MKVNRKFASNQAKTTPKLKLKNRTPYNFHWSQSYRLNRKNRALSYYITDNFVADLSDKRNNEKKKKIS